nr:MAG TPA: hypothetical protein [Caudoviricetes sp.]
MALARKCDRCGSFYIPKPRKSSREGFNAINLINRALGEATYSNGTYDLCPNCSDSLLNWLNNNTCKEA